MMEPVQPLHDWVLVKLDKVPEKRGSIIVPADSQLNNVRTATVVAIGKGRRRGHHREHPGVEKGEKVAFLRWHLEHKTGVQITHALEAVGEDLGLIKTADILFAYSPSTNVEVTL